MQLKNYVIDDIIPGSGVSKKTGEKWESLELRVSNKDDRFESCLIVRLTPKARENFNFRRGDAVDLDIDFSAHEWNGRWFNEINCWKVTYADRQQPF